MALLVKNHLCNFGREHHGEQFREIILNLDLCVQEEMSFSLKI